MVTHHSLLCPDGSDGHIIPKFSHDEVVNFEKRLRNGYDLTSDKQYNLWLHAYHSERAQGLGQVTAGVKCTYVCSN